MAIVKMKRLHLIVLEQEREELLSRFQRWGWVEICKTEGKLSDPQWAKVLHRDSSDTGELRGQLNQTKNAMDAIRKYAKEKAPLFEKRPELSEEDFWNKKTQEDAVTTARTVAHCLSQIARLRGQESRLLAEKESLLPWASLDLPVNEISTEHVWITLGVCPVHINLEEISGQLALAAPMAALHFVSKDRDQNYVVLFCHTSEAEAAETLLKTHAFSPVTFTNLSGTAAENIARVDDSLAETARLREEEETTIAGFRDFLPALKHCYDLLQQEIAKEGTRDRMLTDGTVVFLEGWAVAGKMDRLITEFGRFHCAYEFTDPEAEDEVPTLLKNPRWMRPINMVTEMYSLPAYNGIDPNPFIFWFFIAYFGFMFADIAYGIIIFVACTVIYKKYKPKNTLGYLFGLGRYLGISTIFFGILTGGLFGDVVTVFSENFLGKKDVALWSLFNPLSNPMQVLIIALCVGAVQMFFGQCIHIYMNIRDGKPLEGFLDVVPWWIVFAGIAVYALKGTAILILIGALALVATQGRHSKGFFGKLFGGIASLYNITSWLGDILSYSRLMALMLASTVIASVMNILGALPGNIFAFILVFLIGHTFNIGVNLIGTYVHGARLQYLEFFSKFYIEGGVPFSPLKYDTKYVDVMSDGEVD